MGYTRWLGARIGKRVSKMLKQWEAACKAEKKSAEKATGFKKFSLKLNSITTKKELNIAQQRQADYHENLQGIAEEIHPFSLNDNRINEAEDIKKNLESRAQQFEKIAQSQSIQDSKKVMQKFRNQFQPLAVSISFWWLLVRESLQALDGNKELEEWLTNTLLPVVYWHHKMQQTKSSKTKKKYRRAWENASDSAKVHPYSVTVSESEMQRWLAWAENMTGQFHRSSSAVEGRNGCLSGFSFKAGHPVIPMGYE